MKKIYFLFFLLISVSSAFAQPWFYDFGNGTGVHTTDFSTTFLPAPSSGIARVRVGSGGGSFNLENPGLPVLGTNSELRVVAPTGGSVNKFSIHDYTPGKVFYNKFFVVLGDNAGGSTSGSGEWYFFQGDGAVFADNNAFTGTQTFTGLRWILGAGGTITTSYRLAGNWINITAPSPLPLTQGNIYNIEIYGNNTLAATTYNRGGTQDLAINTWDLWINGVLVGNDLGKALQPGDSNIDSWMFYGESSVSNLANIFLDDFEYSNTLPPATPNTITVGTLTGAPFTLANCGVTAPGNIDFTSTGTFSAGNIYTVQLSDATGSFASPANIGSLASTGNTGNISFTIPAGTLSGTNYRIRIVSSAPITTSDLTADFTIIQNGACGTAITDYFRSINSGPWNNISTWESSPDNMIWQPATLIPDSLANIISIRNGDSVVINGTVVTADQLFIENGGLLENRTTIINSFIINNGAGDDMTIRPGGIYLATSSLDFIDQEEVMAGARVRIQDSGTIRIESTAGSAKNAYATTPLTYIWENGSVFDWNTILTPGATSVSFFPDVSATEIPIWRFSATPLGQLGGAGALIVNGLLDAATDVIFTSASDKTFRNGITGNGNVSQVGVGTGKIIINGITATLGGGGVISTINQVDIGPNSFVSLRSGKSVVGNIQLLSNGFIQLDTADLTVTGLVNGGSLTSHIITNDTGMLVINNISGPTPIIFPIGATQGTINPMAFSNGDGLNYGARVEIGINPPISVPLRAVNRTWTVRPSGTPTGPVNTNFFYSNGEGNASFNYTANLELGLYTGVWNVIQSGLMPAGMYQVATTVSNFGEDIDAPLVLANLGAILPLNNGSVAVNYFNGNAQFNAHKLNWKVSCISTPSVTISLERRSANGNFTGIYSITADALRCNQPFEFTDLLPLTGNNFYRLKLTDAFGAIKYSNTITLNYKNAFKEYAVISPNPVKDGLLNLSVNTTTPGPLSISITDMTGRVLQNKWVNCTSGNNTFLLNLNGIPAGVYQLITNRKTGDKQTLRLLLQ